MSTFSRLYTKQFWAQQPEYKPNFVDYSLQIIKTHITTRTVWEKKISMDLNNKRKKIDGGTRSDEIFALLDEVNSNLEDDIDNLMNPNTEFVLKKK